MVTVQCTHAQCYLCLNTNTGETNDRDRRVAKGQHLYHDALNSLTTESTVRHWSQHQCCKSQKKSVHGLKPHACVTPQHHVLPALRAGRSTPTFHSRIPSPTSSIIDTDATCQFPVRHQTLEIIFVSPFHSNPSPSRSDSIQQTTPTLNPWSQPPASGPLRPLALWVSHQPATLPNHR